MATKCEVCDNDIVHMGGFWVHLKLGFDHLARPPKGTQIPQYDFTDLPEDLEDFDPKGEEHAE